MRSLFRRPVLALALALADGSVALAQDDAPPAGGDGPTDQRAGATVVMGQGGDEDGIHAEGEYSGVVPGKAPAKADTAAARPGKAETGKARPLVTWVGFQAQGGGGARVFVRLSKEVAFEQRVVGEALVVRLRGVKLGTRTHGKFIDTSFFASRVARIEAKNLGAKGVQVTVRFKQGGATKADAKIEQAADGSTYLYLDFAP